MIERAVVVTQGALLGPEDLPARVRTGGRSPESGASKAAAPGASELEQAREKVHQFEATMLQEALAATGWNRAEAARKLGMAVRTLSYRLKVLGVKKPESLPAQAHRRMCPPWAPPEGIKKGRDGTKRHGAAE